MAKANETWKVLPHGPLEKLSSRVWRVQGDLPNMPLKRVMTLVRMADGGIVIHNAMALEEPLMKEIEAWGPVAYIIVPSGSHRLDAPAFKKRYPNAKVLCPPGASAKVTEVVPIDGVYGDFPADPHVSFMVLEGVGGAEGVMTVRDESGVTLVFNDALFNMPHLDGLQGLVLRHLTQSSGGPRVSRVARLLLLKDKAAFAAHLRQLAGTEGLTRVIVSHHETIDREPAAALRQVAGTL